MQIQWLKEMDDRLRVLWDDDKTAKQCVDILSEEFPSFRFTRSSIMGKIRRLGLVGRRALKIGRPLKPHRPHSLGQAVWARPKTFVPQIKPLDDLDIPEGQRKSLLELENGHCRWPVGDVGKPGFFFCGGPVHKENPYCLHHCYRAYRIEFAERRAA